MRKGRHSPTRSRAEVAEGLAHIERRDRQELRRRRRSAARLGPLRRAGLDAGDDGHRPQPRPQRRDRRGPRRRLGRSALRLGQLPPLHPDVFGRRPRPRSRRLRGGAGDRQGGQGRPSRHRARGGGLGAADAPLQGNWSRSFGRGPSRRTSTSSSGARSAPCSAPGSRSGRRPIAASIRSPATGAPRSTSRRWCSAIWARHRPPASPSPATLRPASALIMANI